MAVFGSILPAVFRDPGDGRTVVDPTKYRTSLTPDQEAQFALWKATHAPNDSGADYDLRGVYMDELAQVSAADGHMRDTYKRPNHPTFSNESIYAPAAPDRAGRWEGEKYIPPDSGNVDLFNDWISRAAKAAWHGITLPGRTAAGTAKPLSQEMLEADWRNYSDTPPQAVPGTEKIEPGLADAVGFGSILPRSKVATMPSIEQASDLAGVMLGGGVISGPARKAGEAVVGSAPPRIAFNDPVHKEIALQRAAEGGGNTVKVYPSEAAVDRARGAVAPAKGSWDELVAQTMARWNVDKMEGRAMANDARVLAQSRTGETLDDMARDFTLGSGSTDKKSGAVVAGAEAAKRAGDLPMDQASRLQRAKELGFDTDRTWYHGTTHEFDRFHAGQTNPESHMGQGNYFTSSPVDASANYAGHHSPDLTGRIEHRAEQIMSERAMKTDKPEARWGTDEYKANYESAKAEAAREIAGSHEGAIIPAHLRMKKPLDITPEKSTWLDFSAKYDRHGEFVDDGALTKKLHSALIEQGEKYGFNGQKAFDEISESGMLYDEVKAHQLDQALRKSESIMYAEHPENGALMSHQIIADVYKKMGFDGVVMAADEAFPNMKNIPKGTTHAIVFKDEQVRSPQAAFDPKNKKKPMLLGSGATDEGTAAAVTGGNAALRSQPFYSALAREIDSTPIKNTTGDQWAGFLTNRPGIKQEELEATGLKSWLTENKNKVLTKDDVADFMQANQVKVDEVVKGDPRGAARTKEINVRLEQIQDEFNDLYGKPDSAALAKRKQDLANEQDALRKERVSLYDSTEPTRYGKYVIPGGENYREMLFKLPRPMQKANDFIDGLRAKYGDGPLNNLPLTPAERRRFDQLTDRADDPTFQSSHWPDDKNVLAHMRMSDRDIPVPLTAEEHAAIAARKAAEPEIEKIRQHQDNVAWQIQDRSLRLENARRDTIFADLKEKRISLPEANRRLEEYVQHPELKPLQDRLAELRAQEDALNASLPPEPKPATKRALHIEEVQSDWHQKGKKEGYRDPEMVEAARKEYQQLWDQRDQLIKKYNDHDNLIAARMQMSPEDRAIESQISERLVELGTIQTDRVPDAPFKNTWPDLAMKRALKTAADEGYDKIVWTPGKLQNERYDLRKTVDYIDYRKQGDRYELGIVDKQGEAIKLPKETFSANELADVVGKEVAEKIVSGKGRPGGGRMTLSADDLEIGGEGMIGFYDRTLPTIANKLTKKHGGKVESVDIPGHVGAPTTYKNYEEYLKAKALADAGNLPPQSLHSLDITPELREAARKGFPLFIGGPGGPAAMSLIEAARAEFGRREDRR